MEIKNPPKIPKYECKLCDYTTDNKKDYNKHILTLKHIERTNGTKQKLHGNQEMPVQISENNQNKSCYKCSYCNFETSKLSNYNLHLNTMKHKKNIANVKKPSFQCNICDKKFKTNSGLWKHRKNCKVNPESTEEDISNNQDELKEMICSLIERQNELKNQQEEQTRTISQILEKLETLSK